ncbi:hypothetical protein ACJJTC_007332 [Scirpophaga incertulas]
MTKEDTSTTKENSQIDLDTILVNEIGQFGWFQARTILLAIILVIFCAWSSAQYVFNTARITTSNLRSEMSESEHDTEAQVDGYTLSATNRRSITGFVRTLSARSLGLAINEHWLKKILEHFIGKIGKAMTEINKNAKRLM